MIITNKIKAQVFSQYVVYYANYPTCLALLQIIENLLLDKNTSYRIGLKSLVDITNEDLIEVVKILEPDIKEEEVVEYISQKKDLIDALLNTTDYELSMTPFITFSVYQFLISKGYDIPMRLLGGKTLQKSKLAFYE